MWIKDEQRVWRLANVVRLNGASGRVEVAAVANGEEDDEDDEKEPRLVDVRHTHRFDHSHSLCVFAIY